MPVSSQPLAQTDTEACRLCDGQTRFIFCQMVLEKYDVRYAICTSCGSLQTDYPTWLEEAYGIPGVHIDVGQAARVIQLWLRLSFFLKQIDFNAGSQCIDYGGSAGLLTRLMRDSGYDYYSFDPYETAKFANYFQVKSLKEIGPTLISAFEVFEHFPEPSNSLQEMFESGVDIIVFTTQFYEGQDQTWDYLVPFCGQHVFFYSEGGLRNWALQRGFGLVKNQDFWILVNERSKYQKSIEAILGQVMDARFVQEQVISVGWGTSITASDQAYAVKRFVRELRAVK